MPRSRFVLPLLLAGLAAGAGCLWFALRDDARGTAFEEARASDASRTFRDRDGSAAEPPARDALASPDESRTAPRPSSREAPAPLGNSARLGGIVVDEAGAPVADARVALESARWTSFAVFASLETTTRTTLATLATDAQGQFSFEVDDLREFDVRAEAPGRVTAVARAARAGIDLRLTLAAGARLQVFVQGAGDQHPVASARVRVFDDSNGPPSRAFALEPLAEGRTDADGQVMFDGLPARLLHVAAFPAREARGVQSVLTRVKVPQALVIEVSDGIVVSGTVRDADTGAPIADATVSLGGLPEKLARTDARGRYRLGGATFSSQMPGTRASLPALLDARAADRATATIELVLDPKVDGPNPTEVVRDFALGKHGLLFGRVVDARGAPVPFPDVALVVVRGKTATAARQAAHVPSTADGRFASSDAVGEWGSTLVVGKPAYGARALPIASEGEPRGAIDLGPVVLDPEARISGVVVDGSGAAFPGLEVVATPVLPGSKWLERRTIADAAGRFAFGDLCAATWELRVTRASRIALGAAESIEVAAGRTIADVRLVTEDFLPITGRVLDVHGFPVAGVRVEVRRGVGLQVLETATTDEAGAFRVERLARGTYALVAILPPAPANGRETSDVAPPTALGVPAGSRDVELRLSRYEIAEGVVEDASGRAAAECLVLAQDPRGQTLDTAWTDAEGRFRLRWAASTRADLRVAWSAPRESGGRTAVGLDSAPIAIPDVPAGSKGLVARLTTPPPAAAPK